MWLLIGLSILVFLTIQFVFKAPAKSAFCETRHEWITKKQEEGEYLICAKCHYLPSSQAFSFVKDED